MSQDYGIKISLPGSDVKSAADKDLVYSSRYNGMKIFSHNTLAGSGSVAHGVGYIPSFLNFIGNGSQYRLDCFLSGTNVTSTNITFTTANNYYFIFVDKLA